MTSDEKVYEAYRKYCATVGVNPMPFESWMKVREKQLNINRRDKFSSQEAPYNSAVSLVKRRLDARH